jgi:hypothetical protein
VSKNLLNLRFGTNDAIARGRWIFLRSYHCNQICTRNMDNLDRRILRAEVDCLYILAISDCENVADVECRVDYVQWFQCNCIPNLNCHCGFKKVHTFTIASPADENRIFLSSDSFKHSTLPRWPFKIPLRSYVKLSQTFV